MQIRPLRPDDDRTRFRSGDVDLDRFFAKYAGQNQFRHHVGTTYVAVEDRRIAGFVTLAAGHLESEALSSSVQRKLPRYPLPILRLARLAVDESVRGMGVGQELLRAVFELALDMASRFGCVGVVVDAMPGAVDFYAKFGFTAKAAMRGQTRGTTPMFISITRLRSALPSPGRTRPR